MPNHLPFGKGAFGAGAFGDGAYPTAALAGVDLVVTYNIKAHISVFIVAQYDVGDIPVTPPGVPPSVVEEFVPTQLGSFAQRVYDNFEPLTKTKYAGNDFNYYIGGLGEPFQEIDDYARNVEDDPGWSILLDVHRIPEKGLPWLGQFVGVDIDYDQDVRQQVRSHDRWGRGTPLSMIGPAERYVPAGSEFFFSERNPTPWHIVVIQVDSSGVAQIYEDLFELFDTYHKVRTEYSSYQTLYGESRGDWTQFEQTLLKSKPAGIQVTFITTDTVLYMAIWIIYPTYQPVWNDYASYDALLNQPFPDITVDVPSYRQLISTKYYRSIYNQFNSYQLLGETYVQY